jgi:hypothetical protein
MPSTSTSLMAREHASRAGLDRARAASANLRRSGSVCRSVRFPAGVAQLVERQPSKLNVASSNLVSRSVSFLDFGAPTPKSGVRDVCVGSSPEPGARVAPAARVRSYSAHLAQLVEHVLGKDEVTSSILVVGSKRLGHVFPLTASDTLPRVVIAVDRGHCSSACSPALGRAGARVARFTVAAA